MQLVTGLLEDKLPAIFPVAARQEGIEDDFDLVLKGLDFEGAELRCSIGCGSRSPLCTIACIFRVS